MLKLNREKRAEKGREKRRKKEGSKPSTLLVAMGVPKRPLKTPKNSEAGLDPAVVLPGRHGRYPYLPSPLPLSITRTAHPDPDPPPELLSYPLDR